ncbi:MAG: four-helix bundle copper-binding protein [Mycobacteriaceae bacterium]|nr:four-helix bundle copper-binding protein [Mycobacteriaceae bacterium]
MAVTAQQMLMAQPVELDGELPDLVARAVEALGACTVACTSCAGSCLAEKDPGSLADCVVACTDCADLCATTARMLLRPLANTRRSTGVTVLAACIGACETAAAECARHELMHRHCRLCAEACRECLQVCRELLAAL